MLSYSKIVFTKPEHAEVQLDTLEEQSIPKGQFLLQTMYSLVSAGTETACYRGVERWFPLPGTPGYSCVGKVLAKAGDVESLQVGDLVFCRGKHAGLQLMPQDSLPISLAPGTDLRYAPFARMAAISISSLRVSDIELGDDVLVIGLGLIGNFAAQLAALQGANVVGMDLSPLRLDKAKACGVGKVLLSSREDQGQEIKEAFGGRMPRTVIDATGIPKVTQQGMNYVEKGGRMILLGSPRGECTGDLTGLLQHVHQFRFQIDLVGAHEQVAPRAPTPYVKHSGYRNERICLELIAQGKLVVEPLLTHLLPPSQADEVYQGVLAGDERYLGVVYDWTK